jgi:hypothetical protein
MAYNSPFPYSIGNKKVGKDTIIFNMNSSKNCPSKALGLCKHPEKCYAAKAERSCYPACLPFRIRQEEYWDRNSSFTIAVDFSIVLERHKKVKYIRFSESGDFKSQGDVNKFYQIADLLYINRPDIKLYGYTARRDLQFQKRPNVALSGTYFMIDNMFSPMSRDQLIWQQIQDSGASKVCMQDCKICNLCKEPRNLSILTKFH